MKKVTWKTVRLLFFAVGAFLLWGIVQKIGWEAIQQQFLKLNWMVFPIFLVGFLWYLSYTGAWKQILKQQGNNIPYGALFRAKIAGEAVNTLQPANFLGGDPMRIYLLRKSSNITCLTASVVVDRTINSMAIVSVIFLGAIIAFSTISGLPREIAIGTPIFLIVCTGMIVFFLLRQRRGLFSSILRIAKRLRMATHLADKHLPKAEELDEKVSKLYQKSHSAFWEALSFHIAGRLLGVAEVYLIGKTITDDFTLLVALFLATLAPIINMTFTFIPGALGVLEGAYSGALYLLGFDPAIGITIQLVKRIRAILWIGLGVGFISFARHHQRADYSKDPLQQPL